MRGLYVPALNVYWRVLDEGALFMAALLPLGSYRDMHREGYALSRAAFYQQKRDSAVVSSVAPGRPRKHRRVGEGGGGPFSGASTASAVGLPCSRCGRTDFPDEFIARYHERFCGEIPHTHIYIYIYIYDCVQIHCGRRFVKKWRSIRTTTYLSKTIGYGNYGRVRPSKTACYGNFAKVEPSKTAGYGNYGRVRPSKTACYGNFVAPDQTWSKKR